MKLTREEKCSICNHILNRQKNGCTCVGCYCPTCNDAGTGEVYVAYWFDAADKLPRVAGVYESEAVAEQRVEALGNGWVQNLRLNQDVQFTHEGTTGTEEGSERLNPDNYTGKAKLFAEALNHENDLKAENISLRSQLEELVDLNNKLAKINVQVHVNCETAERDLATAQHEFQNFHRLMCERFSYSHDPIDWKRDQASLEEHIAGQLASAQPGSPPQPPFYAERMPLLRRMNCMTWWMTPVEPSLSRSLEIND